jgi:hypothetical protein
MIKLDINASTKNFYIVQLNEKYLEGNTIIDMIELDN